MKLISIIAPIFICATIAEAGKKPKFPKAGHGSGSHDGEEEDIVVEDNQAQETASGFWDQVTTLAADRPVNDIITSFYPKQTPVLAPAVSTTLASSLLALESSWFSSPEQTKADNAIMSAAPAATAASYSINGYVYGDVTTQIWYVTGVPKSIQSDVASYVAAVESVHDRYVGDVAATTTGRGAIPTGVRDSGVLGTQAPMMVAGAAIVGAVIAAVL